jgi:hypothetical protein
LEVKAENLFCERMFGGQVFGAPNALLPASVGHPAIIGLRAGTINCPEQTPLAHAYFCETQTLHCRISLSPTNIFRHLLFFGICRLTGEKPQDYIPRKLGVQSIRI